MKKIIIFTLSAFLLLGSGIAIGSSINGDYNGNPIVKIISGSKTLTDEVPAQIIDGKTMVPLTMLRQLGVQVNWNAEDYSVSVKLPHELTDAEISQISRSVAIIYVYKDGAYLGQGSGFVINTANFGKVLVSNCHVGCIGNQLKITLDGKQYDFNGTPLFANETTDVYGVKMDSDVPGLDYTADFPEVNDSVVAIGYPLEKYAVSKGKIFSVDAVNDKRITKITHSANTDHGSSGGILMDSSGVIIGITKAGYDSRYSGIVINEAMPMIYVQQELDKLK